VVGKGREGKELKEEVIDALKELKEALTKARRKS